MSCLEAPMDLFKDNSEIGLIKQDLILLYTSHEKVRKGCFAKNDANKKEILKYVDAKFQEIFDRLSRIETCLDLQEKHEENFDDLPLLQLASQK